jgi:hypothetical protein
VKPVALVEKDAPVRRVLEWLITRRWNEPISIITVIMICKLLDIQNGIAGDIERALHDYGWVIEREGAYRLNGDVIDRRGMRRCPHCGSNLWAFEEAPLPDFMTSVSMLAREEEVIPKI